jgi:hypothetical protein
VSAELARQRQTVFGDGKGNCFATCIACLLRVPADTVPNFCVDRPSRWFMDCNDWLRERGWTALYLRGESWVAFLPEQHPGLTVIASGPGPRGCDHCVLMRDGKLLHDPHPSEDGLVRVNDVMVLAPLGGP